MPMTITLKPAEVTEKYGRLFCRGLYTLVDEGNGVARIIEECSAKGPVEWDAVNRRRAGGAIENIRVDGTTLIMDTIIGEREVHFGPASKDLGGQGLKALRVEGDEVKTTWVGLAGASVGIGACLPQGPGTICAEYPDEVWIGGAHRVEVTITTPKLARVIFAVDDTDTKDKGASWVLLLKCARASPVGHFLEHKIVQLNPSAPDKTTQCVAVGISFAVAERDIQQLKEYVVKFVKESTFSSNTALAMLNSLRIPKALLDYGMDAKTKIMTVEQARKAAMAGGAELIEITGTRGMIGALAGIGCFDMGIRAAGLPEDFSEDSP
jgi:methanogenesis imperfect marker protein 11